MMRGFPKELKCIKCNAKFLANNPSHKYCGSKKEKTGCAYIVCKKYQKAKYTRLKESGYFNNQKTKKYQNEWQKKQRKLKTKYDERQKKLQQKIRLKNPEKNKILNKMWRARNKEKVLWNNRQRLLKLKGVVGSHTNEEWLKLKKDYANRCAFCFVSEDDLKLKWEKTHTGFCCLTKDHIVPLSKGGTDFIKNIQPLCISCNSKKKDLGAKIAVTCGVFDIFHTGHFNILKKMNELSEYVIVILHDDTSVFENKGHVTVQSFEHRAENLMLTGMVNEVVLTESKNPTKELKQVIKKYEKNKLIYTRGDDWKMFPGRPALEKMGIEIVLHPYTQGVSTSQIRKDLQG